MRSRTLFFIVVAAGAAFIIIGIASAVDANVPKSVPVDGTVDPSKIDVLKPDMNVGSTANVTFKGSSFSVTVKDPDNKVIEARNVTSSTFNYHLVAQKEGVHLIETRNTGNDTVVITGFAQTKSGSLALAAPLLLAVTGIILIGISLRLRRA